MQLLADSGGGGGSTSAPPPSVTTPVYDGAFADSSDIPFAWQEFEPAAAGLYQLAQDVAAARGALTTAQETAVRDWTGPYKDQFDAKCETFRASCDNIKSALEGLADGLAGAWVAARGQQGRICAARGFAKRESEENGLNKFGDSLFGDEEPNKPDNPPKPGPDGFKRSGAPPHEDGCDVGGGHDQIDA